MKTKKFYSIVLVLAMMLSMISPAFAAVVNYGEELENMPSTSYSQKFSDVPKSYWAFGYIAEMVERGMLSGYPDGRFYPDKNVTRAEFAKIMTCAANLTITQPYYSSYVDVSTDDWCSPYIETARYYLSGYTSNGENYYMPNSSALREDIAVALVKLKGYDTTGFDLSIIQTMFTDWQSISSGAQKYVAVAVEQNLISGYDDGTFKGQQGITRAEAATLLWRAYQYGNGNKNFEQEVLEVPEPVVTPAPTKKPEETKVVVKPTAEPEETPEPTSTPKPTPTPTPEPTYGWKVTTIKNGIDGVEQMQTVPNGLSFMYENKIYELADSGKLTVIFDADEFPYQGEEELSKRDTFENELTAYGYNEYDDCYYAAIVQDKISILYNISLDEIVFCEDFWTNNISFELAQFERYLSSDREIKFFKNGDIAIGSEGKIISSNGKVVSSDKNLQGSVTDYIIYGNDVFRAGNYDILTDCDNNPVDCDDPNWIWVGHSHICHIVGKDRVYGLSADNGITSLDINGDAHFLLSFDDIENEEGRKFGKCDVVHYGAITNDESAIYFYDNAYGSIRKIERQ